MHDAFVFTGLPTRVIFGQGAIARLPEEVERCGSDRAFLIHTRRTSGIAEDIDANLCGYLVGRFDRPQMHTPLAVTETAEAQFRASGAKILIAVGGGTAIGLAKALALRTGAASIALPTNYSGSEMTDILGQTDAGRKTTLRDPAIRPRTVIYDVNLTLNMPVTTTVASAFNALGHAIDGLMAPEIDPLSRHMAEQAVADIAASLPPLTHNPAAPGLRTTLLRASWYASAVLNAQPMALQHRLAHVIGGRFGTDHAATHAAILPYTTAYNEAFAGDCLDGIRKAVGPSVATGLWKLAAQTGAPRTLKSIGLAEKDLVIVVDELLRTPFANPRPLDHAALYALLHSAWLGQSPDSSGGQ